MSESSLLSQIFFQLINTTISAITIIILSYIAFFLLRKKVASTRKANRLKSRIAYIATIVFLLAVVRIWIEGFTHLFTMLSLVSAAIVITNKETVMNIMGWIIINWRSLFAEGDDIQVQSHIGCVIKVKLLYFTIRETTTLGNGKSTGKIIKIPNSIIIVNPIITFEAENNLILHENDYIIHANEDYLAVVTRTKEILSNLIREKYQFDTEFYKSKILNSINLIKLGIDNFKPNIFISNYNPKDRLITVKISFYCLVQDKEEIEFELNRIVAEMQIKIIQSKQ